MKRIATIDEAKSIKVGDLVTTDFISVESHVVRKITDVITDIPTASGCMARADGGMPCLECGRPLGTAINYFIDASWFIKED